MADFELPGYELYERLGRGGMASVYRALHLNLDREVAIKVMDPAMSADENFSERFIREARISARLAHPNILQIYDVNTFNGLNYIAMEYLPGGDLADIIHTALPQRTIYNVMLQMTEALDYAAGRGYVHRDIKPSNIMMRKGDDYVLADFGIARAANSGTQMTQTGLMVGTPSYMSPEQAKGLEVDGRSDLYALAVLWYEMMVKELPYDSDSAVTTAVKHLTEAIPTLPERLAAYQPFLDKALAKAADERFQTGKEMYESLREHSLEFNDDDVLTEAVEPKHAAQTTGGTMVVDENATSMSNWTGSTQLSGTSSPAASSSSSGARPYKLEGTEQRERMVSGAYPQQQKKSGGGALKAVVGLILVAGLGAGGYYYWTQQQQASTEGMRTLSSELSVAYKAMESNKLGLAAKSFQQVLTIDAGNAAAKQGIRDVSKKYQGVLKALIDRGDLEEAQALLDDMGKYYSGDPVVAEFGDAIYAAQQKQADKAKAEQLAAEKRQQINALLDQANALAAGLSKKPQQGADAVAVYQQVLAEDPANGRAKSGLKQVENFYLDGSNKASSTRNHAAATTLVDAGLAAFPKQKTLLALQQSLPGLKEQWAEEQAAAEAEALRLAAEQEAAAKAEQEAVASADEALAALGRGETGVAHEAYEELSETYPDLGATLKLRNQLQAAYANLTKAQIEAEDYDAAEEALSRGEDLVPGAAEWLELAEEIESARSSARRRLGAF